ncbi:hypothetical protein AVEN_266394-1 [Araneus ventricosus]|uniref:Uncharacterized protein n=1 Tax=Araneus ventricosus TaxID=182803 RepID=A0A4Y2F7A7_ARAVE|nr:hypothetical protein AVEN_266394-1 [Araneus ventricosus]
MKNLHETNSRRDVKLRSSGLSLYEFRPRCLPTPHRRKNRSVSWASKCICCFTRYGGKYHARQRRPDGISASLTRALPRDLHAWNSDHIPQVRISSDSRIYQATRHGNKA